MALRLLSALKHLVAAADPTLPSPVQGMEYYNSTVAAKKVYNGSAWMYANEFVQTFTIQGNMAVGVTGRKSRLYNRTGSPWLIVAADLYLATAPTGAGVTLQVNKNGTSSFSPAVAATVQTNSSTPNIVVANGDYLDVDVTAIGSTITGADATLTLSIVS